ncbi:NAD(P)-dependent oxidoreductase [Leekyejoonella antrihumi]|uniref:NAD(P)-dependent oxidoreductase n=2 Tax=Leekyejoonella antrihumi TaxID=1660198 RepID=A0A563E950_9MICO|nr:NAD(P)-dependent oxidoreductase [Leekyejoonella antrihumi]
MSGGSRGIGLAIALAVAHRGGNIVLLAKTDQPHPRLPGTIHTAAQEIEDAGGQAAAIVGDVRNDADIERAVQTAVDTFGGVDIVVNNASVLDLSSTADVAMKKFDLMQAVNTRGTFALTKACLPHLIKSDNGHILTLSPPLNLSPNWLGAHPAYLMAKYGMTLATLGFAAEYAEVPVSANCLWPQSTIATAAVANLLGGDETVSHSRSPQIVADCAIEILSTPAGSLTGQTLIDVDVLRAAGHTDLSGYGGTDPISLDIFVDEA